MDEKLVDAFFTEAEAAIAWHDEGAAEALRPAGGRDGRRRRGRRRDPGEGRRLLRALQSSRVRPARRERAQRGQGGSRRSLGQKTIGLGDVDMLKLPLAKIEPGKALPLASDNVASGIDPAWLAAVRALSTDAVMLLLGVRGTLSESDWSTLKTKLAEHRAWAAKKPGTKTFALDAARLREIVASDLKAQIKVLIAKDLALAPEYAAIGLVEKAIRYRADLLRLLRNFVNFSDFYNGRGARQLPGGQAVPRRAQLRAGRLREQRREARGARGPLERVPRANPATSRGPARRSGHRRRVHRGRRSTT